MNLEQFFQLAQSHGVEGLVVALLVLVFVYAAKFSGLIKSGNVARGVNVVLSIVFGGYTWGDDASAFVATIAAIGSALLYTGVEWAANKTREKK